MKRKVKRTSLATKKTEKFNSISEAAKDIKARNPRPAIIYACQGKQLSAYGYTWKYVD